MSPPEAKIKKYIYGCGITRTLLLYWWEYNNNLEVFYEADYIHILLLLLLLSHFSSVWLCATP